MTDNNNTRWENDKEWAGWTIRDEVYGYVRKHFVPIAVGWLATLFGTVIAAVRSYPTVAYCLGTATVTVTVIVLLALTGGRKPKQPKSRYISGEKGFFDFMVNLGTAQKTFVDTLGKIAQVHTELSARINNHTAAIEQIKSRSGPYMFSGMRRETSRAAKSTNDAAAKFEEYLPMLAESVRIYFESQMGFVNHIDPTNPTAKAQLLGLKEAVRSLRESNAESRESQKSYCRSLETGRGFSQDLNSALDRMIKAVLEIIAVMDDVEAHSDTVVGVIESKLALTVTSPEDL